MVQAISTRWLLAGRPQGTIGPSDLVLDRAPLPELADEEILVRNIYLSLDPTNRLWMSDREQYLPPVGLGELMRGSTLGVVEESRSARFNVGDYVIPAGGGWQSHTIAKAGESRLLRPRSDVPLTAHMSVLGMTGLTAYFGVEDICRPQPDETLVISAAAGAVGSIVGQIGKIRGSRVVGIAGGAAKCSWLVDDLGFDGAIDYKSEEVGSALDRLCPNGIDVNFENVGGPIMDAVFSRLNQNGRMALCGLISGYNSSEPLAGPSDFGRILMNRLTIRGFIVMDYFPRAREALTQLSAWIAEGRLKWKDHVVEGLEQAPLALEKLFTGDHDGKLLVKISSE